MRTDVRWATWNTESLRTFLSCNSWTGRYKIFVLCFVGRGCVVFPSEKKKSGTLEDCYHSRVATQTLSHSRGNEWALQQCRKRQQASGKEIDENYSNKALEVNISPWWCQPLNIVIGLLLLKWTAFFCLLISFLIYLIFLYWWFLPYLQNPLCEPLHVLMDHLLFWISLVPKYLQ